jgi:hypothetical protein
MTDPNSDAHRAALRDSLAAICAEVDRRHRNPPGTAEAGAYRWCFAVMLPAEVLADLVERAAAHLAQTWLPACDVCGRELEPPADVCDRCQPVTTGRTRGEKRSA